MLRPEDRHGLFCHYYAAASPCKVQDAAYCYRCSVVCVCVYLSVCVLVTTMSPAKTDEPIEMPVESVDSGGTKKACIMRGLDPKGKGQFWGYISCPIVKYREYLPEPKLFGRWQQRCGLSLPVLLQLIIDAARMVRGAGSM